MTTTETTSYFDIIDGSDRKRLVRSWEARGARHQVPCNFTIALRGTNEKCGSFTGTVLGLLHESGMDGQNLMVKLNVTSGVMDGWEIRPGILLFFYKADRREGSAALELRRPVFTEN
jgi:hypothetical protein